MANYTGEKLSEIVTIALNECRRVNPDNPQAVAENIGAMVEVLRKLSEYSKVYNGAPFVTDIRAVLSRIEAGKENKGGN